MRSVFCTNVRMRSVCANLWAELTPAGAVAVGWHMNDFANGGMGASKSLRAQALGVITAVSYLRGAS